MEEELICLDTSVLIDYFRKTEKRYSFLYQLTENFSQFSVASITLYEIYVGSNEEQDGFWDDFFTSVKVIPFGKEASKIAAVWYKELKRSNRLIEIPDLFIGSVAAAHHLKLATLNQKHFERLPTLELILPN